MLHQKELEILDFEWAKILKKIQILKILSFIEAIIVLYLGFVLSKDFIIALAVSVFVGVFFYRFLSSRLLKRQEDIKNELLRHFLEQNKAKFTHNLQALVLPFADFKAINGIEFVDFKLYDVSFKNANGGAFMGVLIELKKANFKSNLAIIDENALFERLKNKDFNTDKIYIKSKFALIATLSNPFFISFKLSLKENLAKMQSNLAQIQSLIA